MDCCKATLAEQFTEDTSRRDAERYRKHGLPRRARKLVAAITSATDLKGKSTLEVGVGAGAVTVEMLRHGAAHATGIDVVPAQLTAAQRLAQHYALADKLELIEGDFANSSDVRAADVVVLDRVVCCYEDWQTLLSAAAGRAQFVLAMTYPRRSWWTRALRSGFNFWQRILGRSFRFYVHRPEQMHALLQGRDLKPRVAGRYFLWEVMVAERV